MMRRRVLLTLPTGPSSPYVHKRVMMATQAIIGDPRHLVTPIWPTHLPFENNLHHIVLDFLAGGYDFWLSIDHDNPPMANPLDAVEYNRDIIGFPTPIWHYVGKPGERPIYWNGYDYDVSVDAYREHMPREGLQRVDAVGTGCFLVARRVFLHPSMQKGAFQRTLYADGTVCKGADIAFCERARAAGFEIFCDYDRPCDHFVELSLNEVVAAFRHLYEPMEGSIAG